MTHFYIRAKICHATYTDKPVIEVPTAMDFNAQAHEKKLSRSYGLDIGLPYLVPLTNEQLHQFTDDYGADIGMEAEARVLSNRLIRAEGNDAVIGVAGDVFAERTLQRHLQAVNRAKPALAA